MMSYHWNVPISFDCTRRLCGWFLVPSFYTGDCQHGLYLYSTWHVWGTTVFAFIYTKNYELEAILSWEG